MLSVETTQNGRAQSLWCTSVDRTAGPEDAPEMIDGPGDEADVPIDLVPAWLRAAESIVCSAVQEIGSECCVERVSHAIIMSCCSHTDTFHCC